MTTPLASAIDRMEQAATTFGTARDALLAKGTPPRATLTRVNGALLKVERSLTRTQGLRTRPWYRNLIYASDENNGYADMIFPSVGEAIRTGDRALAEHEITDLASRFDAATQAIKEATGASQ
jgi:N-acetylated-alpha-linked acidic dipeptidase